MSSFSSRKSLKVIRVLLAGLVIALLIAMGWDSEHAYTKVMPMVWALVNLCLVQQRLQPKPQISADAAPIVPAWVPWALAIGFTLGMFAIGQYCVAHYQHPQRQYMLFAWLIPYSVGCIALLEAGKRVWRRVSG
ncbi:hypothetical protein C7S18_05245 [Ahniella affigens]|uniref:Uncharacterized protein n=1 Tax=Ahniella affigens TaxID=2021234 RepID=A0A2P1PP72_9GAMM|nr:hypothetical protein [Ahniella affigens]AVP96644.1 hypothetical protein C7S18_05245 [Ahniella affigens]